MSLQLLHIIDVPHNCVSAVTALQRLLNDECSANFGTYGELFLIHTNF